MNYNPSWTVSYFDSYGLNEWERLVRSPLEEIKLHIHNHYLQAYLPPGSRVLEIGAGPGRFTRALHSLGCRVLVADLSPVQLELNRQKAQELGFDTSVEDWRQLDVCEMDALPDKAFDVVVCYGGPFSYVFERAGQAMQECRRVLKPGGLLFSSVMSLWGSVHAFFEGVIDLPASQNRQIIRTGDLTPETQSGSAHFCHLFRSEEYRLLHERNGFKVLCMSASNALATNWGAALDRCRAEAVLWEFVLEMELEACAQSGYLDGGTHILAVARKENQERNSENG